MPTQQRTTPKSHAEPEMMIFSKQLAMIEMITRLHCKRTQPCSLNTQRIWVERYGGGSFSSSFPHSKIPGIFQDSSYETGILVISMSLSAHKTSSTLTVPQICKRKNHPLLEFSGQSGHGMILPLLRNSRGHTHDSPFSHELSRATC